MGWSKTSLRNLSPSELEEIATYPAQLNTLKTKIKGGMRAVVASTDLNYGLSRVIQSVTEIAGEELPCKIKIFRSMVESIQWLKVDKVKL
ncbi:MAG: hypothetical protein JRE28_11850 [Deltaproteobacteria bacterium]|nr:hypothetical protein [Deltaproteobacteria bacterium]